MENKNSENNMFTPQRREHYNVINKCVKMKCYNLYLKHACKKNAMKSSSTFLTSLARLCYNLGDYHTFWNSENEYLSDMILT